jgi:hypothetical protein
MIITYTSIVRPRKGEIVFCGEVLNEEDWSWYYGDSDNSSIIFTRVGNDLYQDKNKIISNYFPHCRGNSRHQVIIH